MQGIKGFKNIHKGQDVWVIASGSSMDFVDPSFFYGKVTVGVNEVYRKFKSLDYLVLKENSSLPEAVAHVKTENLDLKIIKSLKDCGNSAFADTPDEYQNNESVYIFDHFSNRGAAVDIPVLGGDIIVVSWSTITSAIHFAAYLGAKNIIICGHDCGKLDGKENIHEYGVYQTDVPYINFEGQTLKLAKHLRGQGINVCSLNPFINLGLEGHAYAR